MEYIDFASLQLNLSNLLCVSSVCLHACPQHVCSSIFVFSPILLSLLQAGAIGDEEEAEEIPLIKPRELREEDSIFSSNKPKQNNATNLFISEVVSGKLHCFVMAAIL